MTGHANGIRFTRVQPIGKSLVVSYPKGMSQKFAERSTRALLDQQPRHRFPDYQRFSFTDDHQLVISGLGHDLDDIMKFDNELQGVWFRAWQRSKNPHRRLLAAWLRRDQAERRDKRITLVVLSLLLMMGASAAWGQTNEGEKDPNLPDRKWNLLDVSTIQCVEADIPDDIVARFGITQEEIVRDAELMLMREGVPINLQKGEREPTYPRLRLRVSAIEIPDMGAHAIRFDLQLRKKLRRHLDEEFFESVTSYNLNNIGLSSDHRFEQFVRDQLLDMVGFFALEYRYANMQEGFVEYMEKFEPDETFRLTTANNMYQRRLERIRRYE